MSKPAAKSMTLFLLNNFSFFDLYLQGKAFP